jgi:hypothetical protein
VKERKRKRKNERKREERVKERKREKKWFIGRCKDCFPFTPSTLFGPFEVFF